jgi:hypothetical protein
VRRTRLPTWRVVIVGLAVLVILGVTVTSAYQLIAGRVIEARVLSSNFSDRDCEVAWNYHGHHGTDNTDCFGERPGDLMKVTYVPGLGVTNQSSEIATVIIVPGAVVVGYGSYLIQRRRRIKMNSRL